MGEDSRRVLQILESLDARLRALEERSAGMPGGGRSAASPENPSGPASGAPPTVEKDPRFWVLGGLRERYGAEGVVVLGGRARSGADGQEAEFQWGRPADHLSAVPWEGSSDALAALGHPLRLQILQAIHLGTDSVAGLVEDLGLASSGLAYHHLNQLLAARWIVSASRGRYRIPPSRVIPLLAIMTAVDSFHG